MRQRLIHLAVVFVVAACTTTDSRQLIWPDGTPIHQPGGGVVARNGIDGKDGRDGPVGAQGAKGDRGEKGEKGSRGEAGPAGERGRDGSPGRDGAQGRDGMPGKDGERGRDGSQGRDGRDGANGRDGRDGRDGAAGQSAQGILVPQPVPLTFFIGADKARCGQAAASQPPCESQDGHGIVSTVLAILGGIGGFVTACTPLLTGWAKLYFDRRDAAERALATEKAAKEVATQQAVTDGPAVSTPVATALGSTAGTALSAYPLGWRGTLGVGVLILFGGMFFAYLLVTFAIALLIFICAFMLCSGALLVAFAYAYKLIGESDMRRERHALRMATLAAEAAAPAPSPPS